MNRKRHFMPNDDMAAVLHYPIRESVNEGTTGTGQQSSWFARRLSDIGARTMATPTSPQGWNWTAVTGIISIITLVLVLVGLLCTATWFIAVQSGKIERLEQLRDADKKELQEAKQDAAEAKKLQTYQAGVADTHGTNRNKKDGK